MEFPSLTRRILVVDDDPARASSLVAILDAAAKRWLVETALSGRGALAALTARKFDMLITDLHVAGMGSGTLLATTAIEHPVVAANVLAATQRSSSETDPASLMSRLAGVLEPFGLGGRAAQWLDWTLEAARSAA